jgi:hypothetical protein
VREPAPRSFDGAVDRRVDLILDSAVLRPTDRHHRNIAQERTESGTSVSWACRSVVRLGQLLVLGCCTPMTPERSAVMSPHIDSLPTELAIGDAFVPRHAWLAAGTRFGWTREPLDQTAATIQEAEELTVVGGDGLALRLRIESDTIRVLAWFPRASLNRAPTGAVVVASTPSDVGRASSGVTLRPGAKIRLGPLSAGARHVSAVLSEATFEGWVADADLGDVFDPRGDVTQTTVDALVEPNTPVFAGQLGSKPIAWLRSDPRVVRADPRIDVTMDGAASATFAPIRWIGMGDERVTIEGWVDARRVTRKPTDTSSQIAGTRGFAIGGVSDATEKTLPAGSGIYIGNERVGITRADVIAYVTDFDPHARRCSVEVLFPLLGFQYVEASCTQLR